MRFGVRRRRLGRTLPRTFPCLLWLRSRIPINRPMLAEASTTDRMRASHLASLRTSRANPFWQRVYQRETGLFTTPILS